MKPRLFPWWSAFLILKETLADPEQRETLFIRMLTYSLKALI
jgi:hypothetical protein